MLQEHFATQFQDETTPRFTTIIGQRKAKDDIRSALASGRHIILVGQPGIGKTTIAKSVAELLPDIAVADCSFHCDPDVPACPECIRKEKQGAQRDTKILSGIERFVRVQGSPDLTAEDLLGDIDPVKALEYGPLSLEAFTPGKIFQANKGILFFDEINRAPAKLQNALLQVLEEGYATIGSYRVDFPTNFILIGTMNPQDSSTEDLSPVFLDRFDLVYMHHPSTIDEEARILSQRPLHFEVTVDEKIRIFIASFIQRVRGNENVVRAPSVRASIGLYERAQANAHLRKAAAVGYRDVFSAVMSVLPHRLELKPSVKYLQSPSGFVKDQLQHFAKQQNLSDELDESDVP